MIKHKVLIIGNVWVEPNSSAAGLRMLQLIKLFLNKSWDITFACSAKKTKNEFSLVNLNIEEVFIELNNSSFDDFLKKTKPTIVLFDRFLTEEKFGWRVAEVCPNAIRILDTEDLHFLRNVRANQYKKRQKFTNEALLNSDEAKREIASILRCDLSLIISTFEMNLLKSIFNINENLLYYLPFLLDKIDKNQTEKWKTFEERQNFIFIGNYYHKPNIDAVITLKMRIWESIRKVLPKSELHIYGSYMNQQIQQFHNEKEGFIVKGFTEDSKREISKAKVLLAPINFGAGIKGKLTEAMICGTPSITTKIGAEGMHSNLSWSGIIADDFNEFSKNAVKLYSNKSVWEISQKNGIEIINSIYDKEKLEKPFINKISELKDSLKEHRTKNFLGSLLQYQTLQATKYMSKWIELKNTMQ